MQQVYDVIVIGGGPAGCATALTVATDGKYSVCLLEAKDRLGGQIGTTSLAHNILLHPDGLTGERFACASTEQLLKFGVAVWYNFRVEELFRASDGLLHVKNWRGDEIVGRSVVLATGMAPKWLGIPGEDLEGVIHGMDVAALSDPTDKHVALIGGGNSVGQAVSFYAAQGVAVTVIARNPLHETMDRCLADNAHVEAVVLTGEVTGIWRLKSGRLKMRVGPGYFVWVADLVHVMIGQEPKTDWLDGVVGRTPEGYIYTDDLHRALSDEPGIFAVGDVVQGSVKRAGCAMGYGFQVVPSIYEYLKVQ